MASDSTEAVHIAEDIGYPVALKLRSPDIPHKSEVQGVMLYLRTANEVQQAANAIFDRVKMTWPQAWVHGLLVQSMLPVLALRSCGLWLSTIRFSGR
ncbi:acetate--CoA ligase family protein [Escherichia coli]